MLGSPVPHHPASRLCPTDAAAARRFELRARTAEARVLSRDAAAAEQEWRRRATVDDHPTERAARDEAKAREARAQRGRAQEQQRAWESAAQNKLDRAAEARDGWVGLRARPREDPSAAAKGAEQRRARDARAERRAQRQAGSAERSNHSRLDAASRRSRQHVSSRRSNAARLNSRVTSAAAAREQWDAAVEEATREPQPARPAWAQINSRRKEQAYVAPAVDPTAYAEQQAKAKAHAERKRGVTNCDVFRWRNAELMEVEELRDRCETKGLSRLGAAPELEARLAANKNGAMAAGRGAPYTFSLKELVQEQG